MLVGVSDLEELGRAEEKIKEVGISHGGKKWV